MVFARMHAGGEGIQPPDPVRKAVFHQKFQRAVGHRRLVAKAFRRQSLHRALGAYDVLQRLAAEGFGNQPPVAYRALEFLVENGLAHRIRRLNAFTACMHPGEVHSPAFLICRLCDGVAAAPAAPVRAALDRAAAGLGFAIERSNIEALGLCPACQDVPA